MRALMSAVVVASVAFTLGGCSSIESDRLSPAEAADAYVSSARSEFGIAIDDGQLANLGQSLCEGLRGGESPTSMRKVAASQGNDLKYFYVALAAAPRAYCSDQQSAVAAYFSVGAAGDEYSYLVDLVVNGSAANEAKLPAEPYGPCQTAMLEAAAVPASQVNDSEMSKTLAACSGVDEWEQALRRWPNALGMTVFTSADVSNALRAACAPEARDSLVCQNARSSGRLSY
jgi:hypothetical protein